MRTTLHSSVRARRAGAALVALIAAGAFLTAATPASATVAPPPGGSFVTTPTTTVFAGSIAAAATGTYTVPGVPAGAAAWLTVSESAPAHSGMVIAYTAGGTVPSSPAGATLSFAAGQSASNSTAVKTSSAGKIAVKNTSSGAVAVRIDVSGYYATGTVSAAGSYGSVTPFRVANAVSVAAHGTVGVTVAGAGGVPSTAAVVLLNLAVATPGATGVLTAYPTGSSRPDTQNLVFTSGHPVATANAVRVGTGGQVTVYNSSAAAVSLSAAVLGYFVAGTPHVGRTFTKVAPAHALDTSTGLGVPSGPIASHGTVNGTITGVGGVPTSGVSAVVLQVSAFSATATGYLTVFPAGGTRPATQHVQFAAGRNGSTLVIVPSGRVSFYNSASGTVQMRADIVGYYAYASTFSWSSPTTVQTNPSDSTDTPVTLSCSSSTTCVLGGSQYARIWNGTSWSSSTQLGTVATTPDGFTANITDSTCISATFCVVSLGGGEDIDTGGGFAVWHGSSWSIDDHTFSPDLRGMSCTSTTFCMAVGPNVDLGADPSTTYDAVRYDGSTATDMSSVFTDEMDHVSCVSSTYCLAVGTNGSQPVSSVWNGTSWSGEKTFASGTINAVSCQTTTFCLAVDATGRADTWNGTSWSAPATVVSGSSTALTDIDCQQAAACIAAGTNGGAQYRGLGVWHAPGITDAAGGPLVVSCPSAQFCMTADNADEVTIGKAS